MIDIIISAKHGDDFHAGVSATELSETVKAPHRVILGTCGLRDDFPHTITEVAALASPTDQIRYKHIHSKKAISYGKMIERSLRLTNDLEPLFLLVPQGLEKVDKDWFQKVKRVFDVDPRAGALLIPPSLSVARAPSMLQQRPQQRNINWMIAVRRDLVPVNFDWTSDLGVDLPTALMPNHFNVWIHPGIPYVCREKCEAPPTPFASPSPTTVD